MSRPTELDTKRAWLIPYLQGWGWKLDECCSGMHVHKKAQIRQAIITWLEILQSPNCNMENVEKIELMVPDVITRARKIYLEHLTLKRII